MGEGADAHTIPDGAVMYFHKRVNAYPVANLADSGDGGVGIYHGIFPYCYGSSDGNSFGLDKGDSGFHKRIEIAPLQDAMGLRQFTP